MQPILHTSSPSALPYGPLKGTSSGGKADPGGKGEEHLNCHWNGDRRARVRKPGKVPGQPLGEVIGRLREWMEAAQSLEIF
jgi:hypothetical protein